MPFAPKVGNSGAEHRAEAAVAPSYTISWDAASRAEQRNPPHDIRVVCVCDPGEVPNGYERLVQTPPYTGAPNDAESADDAIGSG